MQNDAEPTHKCRICGKTKTTNEMYKDYRYYKEVRRVYFYRCKDCRSRARALWVKNNYARSRELYNSWIKANKERFNLINRRGSKKWRKNNLEKTRAHSAAHYYKNILKKKACEKCGSESRLHMHHPDYEKPLYVITLCNKCHTKEHHAI